jgi:hypothetical protein
MNYIQFAKTYCCNVVALSTIVLLASCGGGGSSTGSGSTTTPPPATFTPYAPTFTGTGALNDSGINASQCYQVAGNDTLGPCNTTGAIALNPAQDGMVGRDVTFPNPADGNLGFSFVPVAGGCVTDNVTGLTWEVKTTDGGLRDSAKTYTYSSAADFVTAVNTSNLCGHSNWRLPTPDELQRIVDYSVPSPGPTIDTVWFPHTNPGVFWSGALYKGDPTQAWGVNFQYGSVSPLYLRSEIHYVRLVQSDH